MNDTLHAHSTNVLFWLLPLNLFVGKKAGPAPVPTLPAFSLMLGLLGKKFILVLLGVMEVGLIFMFVVRKQAELQDLAPQQEDRAPPRPAPRPPPGAVPVLPPR